MSNNTIDYVLEFKKDEIGVDWSHWEIYSVYKIYKEFWMIGVIKINEWRRLPFLSKKKGKNKRIGVTCIPYQCTVNKPVLY